MFEAYAVGVTLKLNNLISPQLAGLATEFEKLEGLTVALNASLRKIGTDVAGLRAVASAGYASNRALERAAVSAAALHRSLAEISLMAGGVSALPLLGGGRGVGNGGSGGGHRNGFHGGTVHMGPGGVGIGSVGWAAGDAFVPLAITAGALYGGHALYESAKDLDTEKERFRLFGLSEAQNREAFRFVEGLHIYGSTQAENMRAFREAQGMFRESGEDDAQALRGAKLAAPVLAKLDFLASSLDEESAAKLRTANMAMLRYIDSSGGINSAEEFNRLADFGYKLNQSSGGTVNWEQLRQFRARAGAAGYNITDEGLARLEPIIGENKGGAVGYGIQTAFNRLTGAIRLPNQVVSELLKEGIWDKSKVLLNAQGGIKRFLGNPLGADKGELLTQDPVLFYERYIHPIYEKMRYDGAEIARQNVMLFGTTGARNMNVVEKQMGAIERSISALRKAKGIDEAVDEARRSISGQEKEFEAAWTDFKTQFGTTMLPFFTGILKAGSSVLRAIGRSKEVVDTQTLASNALRASAGPGGFLVSQLWSLLSRDGDRPPPESNSRFVAPRQSTPTVARVQLNIDKRKVGEAVIDFAGDMARRTPQTGINIFDGRLGPAPAGGIGP